MKPRTVIAWIALSLPATAVAAAVTGNKAPAVPLPTETPTAREAAPAAVDAPVNRGQLLYENHCLGCHESTLHIRSNRRAKSPAQLRAWVQRWAGELKLGWEAEEVEDVLRYLDRQYYKFPPARK